MKTSKAKVVGVKINSKIVSGFKAIGGGFKKAVTKTYENGLTPVGHFVTGVVIGDRDIAAEQKQLSAEKAKRMQLKKGTKLHSAVTKS